MLTLTAAIFMLAGATQVWTENSLVNVFPSTVPRGEARAATRLYATQGESESFQVCVRADKGGQRIAEFAPMPLDKEIGPPSIYSIGYVPLDAPPAAGLPQESLWPDPLLPFAPVDIPPRQTRAFWVTYAVPRDAKPGLHTGTLTFVSERGPRFAVDVTIEVFAFTQPEVPAFRALFPFERETLARVYGLDNAALDAWKPIYDVLAPYRISASLWDGGDLVKVSGGKVNPAAFLEHLDYAVPKSGMSAVNIGSNRDGIAPFSAPVGEGDANPLEAYLHDMHVWLDARGWLDRACATVTPLPAREAWPTARNAFFAVKRAAPAIARLMEGRPHPYWERFAEILAVPLQDAHPVALGRLRAGMSISAEPAHMPTQVTASSAGPPPNEKTFTSVPEDACDGCLFTYWYSAAAPTNTEPQWIEVTFDERVEANSFRIGWRTGLESTDIEVRTSYDGEDFSTARVTWEHHGATGPFDDSWSEGTFRFSKAFRAIRVSFRGSVAGGPVGIGELEFGHAPTTQTIEKIRPLEIWLDAVTSLPPRLRVGAHPVEARFLPWQSWGFGMTGLLGLGLARWPDGWTVDSATTAPAWQGHENGEGFLLYPAPGQPAPSIRLERLRDGIEDYECLAALERAVAAKEITDPQIARLCIRLPFRPDLSATDMDAITRSALDSHVRIGRALTALVKPLKAKGAAPLLPLPAASGQRQ